jgi:hypothetical protein
MIIGKFEERSAWQMSAKKQKDNRKEDNRITKYLRADVDHHLANDEDIKVGGRV